MSVETGDVTLGGVGVQVPHGLGVRLTCLPDGGILGEFHPGGVQDLRELVVLRSILGGNLFVFVRLGRRLSAGLWNRRSRFRTLPVGIPKRLTLANCALAPNAENIPCTPLAMK